MTDRPARVRRFLAGVSLCAALAATGCEDDPTRPDSGDARAYAVVVNSISSSLTVFPLDEPDSAYSIGLNPEGSPVAVAVRGSIAVVPLGAFPAVAIVDLRERAVIETIPVAIGSGPTGVAIANDSLAFVTLSGANQVVPLLYDRDSSLEPIPTGTWPEAIFYSAGKVYVLNARVVLDPFGYEGPGTVTVVDAGSLEILETIELTGTNPGAAVAMDGAVWVLNRGDYGAIGGSLSQIDTVALTEVDHTEGFGFAPGGLAVFDDQIAVASFAYGVALWSPASGFSLAPDDAFRPDPAAAVADVGVDPDGMLYVVDGQCGAPGGVFVVNEALDVVGHADTEVCPFDIAFTSF